MRGRRGTTIAVAAAGALALVSIVGLAAPANAIGSATKFCWDTGRYTGKSTAHSANTTSSTSDCHDTRLQVYVWYNPYGAGENHNQPTIAPGHFVSQANPGYTVDYGTAGEEEIGTFFFFDTP